MSLIYTLQGSVVFIGWCASEHVCAVLLGLSPLQSVVACPSPPAHPATSLEVNPASPWWFPPQPQLPLPSSPCSNLLTRLFPWLKSIDLNKPIDKRIYKGTQPTCHDFNQFTAATETISLLVGFSAGQVQYLDLIKKDTSKLFNEEVIEDMRCSLLIYLPTHSLSCLLTE